MSEIAVPGNPDSNTIDPIPGEQPGEQPAPVQSPTAPDEGAGEARPDEAGVETPDEVGDDAPAGA